MKQFYRSEGACHNFDACIAMKQWKGKILKPLHLLGLETWHA